MTDKQLEKLQITKDYGKNRYWCDAIENTITILPKADMQDVFREIYEVGITKGKEIGTYSFSCILRDLINVEKPL